MIMSIFFIFSITIYNKLFTIFNETLRIYQETFENISTILTEYYQTIQETIEKKIIPAIQSLTVEVQKLLVNIIKDTTSYVSYLFDKIVSSLKQFDTDFGQLGKIVGDFFRNVSVAIKKLVDVFYKEFSDIFTLIMNNIKSYPGFEKLKEMYREFRSQHNFAQENLAIVRDILSIVNDTLPTKETGIFAGKVYLYIESKLLDREVNDFDELRDIYNSFIEASRSILYFIKSIVMDNDLISSPLGPSTSLFPPIPFSMDLFKTVPAIGLLQLSIVNLIKSEPLPSIRQNLATLRPYGFDVRNTVPPFHMRAILSDGQHIFTFDGIHMTFPGDCNYILSQDIVNNNFTIIGYFKQGKLKSISLIDKSNQVEIDSQGMVKLNDQHSDLPVHDKDIHVWRDYYSITLLSQYGVEIFCTIDLRTCHVTISGYYHGRVRGLLGIGNGEPYDDFTLPSNKIAPNFAEFGNAYKIGKGKCQVQFTDHTQHSHDNDFCNQFFSGESMLRQCFYFVDPTNFKEACNHATSIENNKLDAACNIAQTYVSACRRETILIDVPYNCLKCGANSIGHSENIVVPNKKADIVIVVDTSQSYIVYNITENLIVDLRKELRIRDVPDVNIAIIGYNQDQKYPSLFTEQGKLNFIGKKGLSGLNINGPKYEEPIKTLNSNLDDLLVGAFKTAKKIRSDLGVSTDALAFKKAYEYPFRASAAKTILAIRSDRLEYTINPAQLLIALQTRIEVDTTGISINLISPIKNLVHNSPKNTPPAIILGFNKNNAIGYQTEGKKKGIINTPDLKANIKYEKDIGIDTVIDSQGFVFNLDAFNQLKPGQRKFYYQSIAAALADSLSRNEITSDCKCVLKYGLFAEESCNVQFKKVLPSKKVTAQRG